MAYTKRTWKGRQGTGLNKFSINGATPVTITNQPDSVTEQGDALSAGNLNDLETRIDNAFTAVDAEVATKADETEITNLQNALDAIDHRVTNLEVKAGDEIVVTYPSTTYGKDGVPTSVAPYAKVSELIGVSRISNQHIATSVLSSQTVQNVVFSVTADGELQLSGLASGDAQAQIVSNDVDASVAGHKYLLFGGSSNFNIRPYDSLDWDTGSGVVFEAQSALSLRLAGKIVSGTNYNEKLKICVRDLNQYFSSDPDVSVASLTLSDIQTDYPELLIPSSYDAGTKVDTSYTSVKSIGRNRLKPSTFKARILELGGTDNGDGTVTISAGQLTGNVIWENDTPSDRISFCFAGSGEANLYVLYESGVTEWLDTLTTNGTWKTSQNGLRVAKLMGGWASGNSTFTIAKCGILTGSTSTFQDYHEDTLSLGQTVTLGSAGSVRETFDLESGKKTNPLGSYTFTGTEPDSHFYTASVGRVYYEPLASVIAKPSARTVQANIICNNFVTVKESTLNQGGMQIGVNPAGDIGFCLAVSESEGSISDLKTYFSNHPTTITYELATPNPDTQLTPIANPFIEVEGGGTIAPTQSQTVKIDSSMTAEYLAV